MRAAALVLGALVVLRATCARDSLSAGVRRGLSAPPVAYKQDGQLKGDLALKHPTGHRCVETGAAGLCLHPFTQAMLEPARQGVSPRTLSHHAHLMLC